MLLAFASVSQAIVFRQALQFAAPANCSNPPKGLPGYCCKGAMLDNDYADMCECNPGWSHDECICKAYLMQNACNHCMVHLPGTNKWSNASTATELYTNCDDCVTTCKAEFAKE